MDTSKLSYLYFYDFFIVIYFITVHTLNYRSIFFVHCCAIVLPNVAKMCIVGTASRTLTVYLEGCCQKVAMIVTVPQSHLAPPPTAAKPQDRDCGTV